MANIVVLVGERGSEKTATAARHGRKLARDASAPWDSNKRRDSHVENASRPRALSALARISGSFGFTSLQLTRI